MNDSGINMDLDMDAIMGGESQHAPGDDIFNDPDRLASLVAVERNHDSMGASNHGSGLGGAVRLNSTTTLDTFTAAQTPPTLRSSSDPLPVPLQYSTSGGKGESGNAALANNGGEQISPDSRPGAYNVQGRALGNGLNFGNGRRNPGFATRMSRHLAAPFQQSTRRPRRQRSSRNNGSSRRSSLWGSFAVSSARAGMNSSNNNNNNNAPESSRSRESVAEAEIPPELRGPWSRQNRSSAIGRRSVLSFMFGAPIEAEVEVSSGRSGQDDDSFEGDVRLGIMLLVGGACLLAAVVITVVVLLTSKNNSAVAPTTPQETLPPETAAPTGRFWDIVENVEYLSSSPDVFKDESSPQYKAVKWLEELDEAEIALSDAERLESRYALATLFYSTNGGNWNRGFNFLSGEHECDWSLNTITTEPSVTSDANVLGGVQCNGANQITSLILDNNNMRGTIPVEIKALSSLRELRITRSSTNADITSLYNIDAIGGLVNLRILDLSFNAIGAEIPTRFGSLIRLQELILNDNRFFNGFPTELSSLVALKTLNLGSNDLDIQRRKPFESFTKLEELILDNNRRIYMTLEGLAELSDLRILRLNSVTVSSSMAALKYFPNLEELDLGSTGVKGVNGKLPGRNTMPKGLRYLNLATNFLTGTISWSIFGDDMEHLDLSRNDFSDTVRDGLLRLTKLTHLDLARNEMFGPIHTSIGTLKDLRYLSFYGNNMDGTIPESLGDLESIDYLDLSYNEFSGQLPTSLGGLAELEALNMKATNIEGSFDFLCDAVEDLTIEVTCSDTITCSCCGCS